MERGTGSVDGLGCGNVLLLRLCCRTMVVVVGTAWGSEDFLMVMTGSEVRESASGSCD